MLGKSLLLFVQLQYMFRAKSDANAATFAPLTIYVVRFKFLLCHETNPFPRRSKQYALYEL